MHSETTQMGRIRFHRPFQLSQGLQRWRLYVDGRFEDWIDNGSSVEIPVRPGVHEVMARTAIMFSSKALRIEVPSRESIDVEVRAPSLLWSILCSIWFPPFSALWILIFRSSYLKLKLVSSRGQRLLNPGTR
jgi:hypothetical protein